MTVRELAAATGGRLVSGNENDSIERVVIDSREAAAGDVFFALKGEKNDGHDYLLQAAAAGCRTMVVCDEEKTEGLRASHPDLNLILTEDSKRGLQLLGAYYLDSLDLRTRIGVTGSVGKTSTRDFIYYVMSRGFRTARSIKNYNNSFGLPLSLLSFPSDTEAAVVELGMDGKGSIGVLADLVKPDIGVLTNIGISHIENFPEEGREGILKTKLEITQNFTDDSILIVNDSNDMLHGLDMKERGIRGRLIRVGTDSSCDYVVSGVEDKGVQGISFDLEHEGKKWHADIPVPGAHNAINAGLAVACGNLNGISTEDALEGFSHAVLTEKRLSVREKDGIRIIDDTYNAAPDSVKSAINTLMSTKTEGAGRHIAILGDMGELGSEAVNGHRACGEAAFNKGVDVLLAVGSLSENTVKGWQDAAVRAGHKVRKVNDMPLVILDEDTGKAAEFFENKEMVINGIMDHIHAGDCLLIKASRFMALEKIVKHILES